jgi:hypothetical protein
VGVRTVRPRSDDDLAADGIGFGHRECARRDDERKDGDAEGSDEEASLHDSMTGRGSDASAAGTLSRRSVLPADGKGVGEDATR